MDAMKARISCEQRLRQRLIGEIFCSEEGLYPEGGIERYFDEKKATDEILRSLTKEERIALNELEDAVEATEVYQKLFNPIEGCGVAISARIISAVMDIRRFATAPKLKKYMGAHLMEVLREDGSHTDDWIFPRRRNEQTANWQGDARQALYLLADQFDRRSGSEWGQYLILCKQRLRVVHPEPVVLRKQFSQLWRSLDRFFRRHKVVVFPTGGKITTVDELYAFFHAGVSQMTEDQAIDHLESRLKEFEEKINGLGSSEGKPVTLFTPGHIHKMAIWRCITRFVEWLFREWRKLEKSNASAEVLKAA